MHVTHSPINLLTLRHPRHTPLQFKPTKRMANNMIHEIRRIRIQKLRKMGKKIIIVLDQPGVAGDEVDEELAVVLSRAWAGCAGGAFDVDAVG